MTPTAHAQADTLFGGTLTLYQPARGEGYRVNVDAVLLAGFAAEGRRARQAVDLGAGVGAVALSLLYRDHAEHVVLVEKDRELSSLSTKNLAANHWADRGRALSLEVEDIAGLDAAFADLVVCNPPYVAPGRGRLPRVTAASRVGSLPVFARAARHVLAARGRVAFVYPAAELVTLFDALQAAGLEPKRLRRVHAKPELPARVAMVLAMPAKRGGLVVLPPLIERDEHGPSAEVRALLAPAV